MADREYKSPAELHAMSNAELADHIEKRDFSHDWVSMSIREAVARLLREKNAEDRSR